MDFLKFSFYETSEIEISTFLGFYILYIQTISPKAAKLWKGSRVLRPWAKVSVFWTMDVGASPSLKLWGMHENPLFKRRTFFPRPQNSGPLPVFCGLGRNSLSWDQLILGHPRPCRLWARIGQCRGCPKIDWSKDKEFRPRLRNSGRGPGFCGLGQNCWSFEQWILVHSRA